MLSGRLVLPSRSRTASFRRAKFACCVGYSGAAQNGLPSGNSPVRNCRRCRSARSSASAKGVAPCLPGTPRSTSIARTPKFPAHHNADSLDRLWPCTFAAFRTSKSRHGRGIYRGYVSVAWPSLVCGSRRIRSHPGEGSLEEPLLWCRIDTGIRPIASACQREFAEAIHK